MSLALHTCIPKPVSRPAAFRRDGHRNRLLDRAGDRADGPLSRLRAHGDDDDRPCVRPISGSCRVGTKCFEDPSLLDERQRFRALSINGVAEATPVVIGFAEWRLPSGGNDAGLHRRLGHARPPALHPWNLVAGSIDALSVPNAVAVDQSYFERLGVSGPRRHRGNSRPEGARCGGHQGHPLVHDHALRVHVARPGARLYRHRRQQGHLFSGARGARRRRRKRSQPTAGESDRRRGADAPRSFATAAAPSGCSTPAPAPLCSPARCSASSSAPSSSRRRCIPAPRITSTSSQRCARSDRPACTSTR